MIHSMIGQLAGRIIPGMGVYVFSFDDTAPVDPNVNQINIVNAQLATLIDYAASPKDLVGNVAVGAVIRKTTAGTSINVGHVAGVATSPGSPFDDNTASKGLRSYDDGTLNLRMRGFPAGDYEVKIIYSLPTDAAIDYRSRFDIGAPYAAEFLFPESAPAVFTKTALLSFTGVSTDEREFNIGNQGVVGARWFVSAFALIKQ